MCQGYRRGFTAAEKAELWDRWQRGESLKAIGRAFGKPSSSIYFQLAPHGGIRPAPRRRSRLALTLSEREEISRGIAAYQSTRSMARLLGHSPSTVSREISRNGGYDRYRAALEPASVSSKIGKENWKGPWPILIPTPRTGSKRAMPPWLGAVVLGARPMSSRGASERRASLVWGFYCQAISEQRSLFLAFSISFFVRRGIPFVRPDPQYCKAGARRSCQGWPSPQPCGVLRPCQPTP